MLAELFTIQETLEFEEYGSLSLISAVRKEVDLELVLRLYSGVKNEQPQFWKLICHEERTHQIVLGSDGYLKLLDDHVLLWSYTQPVASLTFRSIVEIADAWTVVGKLYEKHIQLVHQWIPFDYYFNTNLPLAQLIASGHGLLAEGPEKLVKGYQQVMNESGFQYSCLFRSPMRWNPLQGWIEESGELLALVLDKSYVVASSVTAEKLVTPPDYKV